MTSAPAIGFDYRPSRVLRQALLLMALLAIAAVGLSGLPPWLKLALVVVVLAAVTHALLRQRRTPIAAAGWGAEGGWTLHTRAHDDLPAVLVSHRVLGGFVLLRLRSQDATHALLLAPDNSDADIRRRLRMRLAALQVDDLVARW